jgi:hypothetical protein
MRGLDHLNHPIKDISSNASVGFGAPRYACPASVVSATGGSLIGAAEPEPRDPGEPGELHQPAYSLVIDREVLLPQLGQAPAICDGGP